MTRKSWKKALVEKTKEEGTYKPSFDIAIDILSEILEERDKVYKLYLEDGSRPVVDVTTDRGQTNKRPNPLLNQWKDLNDSALRYIRELGLSPTGLKKITGDFKTETKKKNSLEEFMKEFE